MVTLLYLALVRPSPAGHFVEPAAAPAGRAVTSGQVLRNRNLWLLAVAFAAHCAAGMGAGTYLRTFLASP